MCLMSDAVEGSGMSQVMGVARELIVILDEVYLRVEPACYNVIFCEDMGKMDLG